MSETASMVTVSYRDGLVRSLRSLGLRHMYTFELNISQYKKLDFNEAAKETVFVFDLPASAFVLRLALRENLRFGVYRCEWEADIDAQFEKQHIYIPPLDENFNHIEPANGDKRIFVQKMPQLRWFRGLNSAFGSDDRARWHMTKDESKDVMLVSDLASAFEDLLAYLSRALRPNFTGGFDAAYMPPRPCGDSSIRFWKDFPVNVLRSKVEGKIWGIR